MSYRLRFEPSGHECDIESSETILEAALRSGLSMRYRCRNGTCGECKGRVIQGHLQTILHHDYCVSEAEKSRNTALLCRAQAGSDLVIEAVEAAGVQDIPLQQVVTTVCKMERPTEDVMVLHLRTPRSKTLQFLSGQHACINIEGATPRNKSIASCPCNGMILQFHVRNVPGDTFARYVFEQLQLRQSVMVEGPFGDFTLDEDSIRPIILIAFETGFAPIKSLIEHAISLDLTQPIYLYWIARDEKDHYLANYCRLWQDNWDNFKFIPLCCDPTDAHMVAQSHALNLDLVTLKKSERDLFHAASRVVADFDDLAEFDVYVNGQSSLLAPTKALLIRHGLPEDRLFIDHVRRF